MKKVILTLLAAAALCAVWADEPDVSKVQEVQSPKSIQPPDANKVATVVEVASTNKLPPIAYSPSPIACPPPIAATLRWTLSTNWHDSGVGITSTTQAISPQNFRHIENGVITSNLVASLVWKGKTNEIILESTNLTVVQRTYRIDQVKVYDP